MADTEKPNSTTNKTSRVAALVANNRLMVYGVTSFVVFSLFVRMVFWAVGWPWVFEGTLYKLLLTPFVAMGWLGFWIWFVDLRPRRH